MMTTAPRASETLSPAARRQDVTRVVVGVDGSLGSLNALLWAFAEARARTIPVRVVLAWQFHPSWSDLGLGSMFPMGQGSGVGMLASPLPAATAGESALSGTGHAAAAEAVHNLLDAVISNAVASDARSTSDPVPITSEAVEGHPAAVLLDAVTDSDLLVVGSRGHGGFVGALLGSVSHHVVSHASYPVVVVPARQRTLPT